MNYDNFKADIVKLFVVHISCVLIFPLYFNYKSEIAKTAKMRFSVQELRVSVLCATFSQSSSSKIIKSRLVAVNIIKQE